MDALQDDLYRFIDIDDPDLTLILKAFNIETPPKLYRRAELKAMKTGTTIFMQGNKSRYIISKISRPVFT